MRLRSSCVVGVLFTVAVLLCRCSSPAAAPEGAGGWIPLIHGDTLDGWYTFLARHGKNSDPNHVFTVNQGVVHLFKDSSDKAPMPFGYIATEKEYSDYHLRLEYRWGVKKFAPRVNAPRDAGVLFHFAGVDAVWPQCVECQVMEGSTGDIFTVGTTATCTVDPETRESDPQFTEPAEGGVVHTQGNRGVTRIKARRDCEREGWNAVEVVVRGASAVYIINGEINNRCTDIRRPDPASPQRLIPLTKGRILLQAEGAEIFYRNIEMKPLHK